ncbi:protein EFFECTOR OF TRANSCRIPTION 2-like isoform X1 [Andrographis paniculata]|uniref:protein EFFECTOR OF TRANSCRIPTION 2-like isoform X1 n=1 Tax=Andrographis paniculata TaxID=175694 RepID=UPI0021E93120|nr:protein EFFECTOR OF TRANSCRIPTION 2-like isoform X1 [Andrographis paniculata]
MGVPAADAARSCSASSTGDRLKRENFRRTKHDSAFSQWKILIGASDWKDYSTGKGSERYRTQNLPNWNPAPGVYELGIAVISGRETRRLDSSSVVPVYLGQADNLRTRLQQYGRDGAHLENGCSNKKSTYGLCEPSHKLFSDVFAKGFPIVYRCAPMRSKKDAEMAEKQLLDMFDYAWNKGSNGIRRHEDIRKKLDRCVKQSQFTILIKKLLSFNQKQVGIEIRACNPGSKGNNGSELSDADHNNVSMSQVFGIRRVIMPPQELYGSGDVCGVALSHGSICTAPPVHGRKRCAAHKGMRIKCSSGLSNKEGNMSCCHETISDQHRTGSADYSTDVCGVKIGQGSICRAAPVKGRKRCATHKGMRADGHVSRSMQFSSTTGSGEACIA